MGIVLGIDYGTKRTGIAITDPMRIIASGLTTVSTNSLEDFIDDIVIKKDINCFVVGKSINLDGGYNQVSDHLDVEKKPLYLGVDYSFFANNNLKHNLNTIVFVQLKQNLVK